MAKQLTSTFFVSGGYLDANVSVSSISELLTKQGFNGQVVHMPKAFKGDNTYKLSYPLDFWKVPYGNGVRWEIKSSPVLEKETDFENFKAFVEEFKTESGYLPFSEKFKVVAGGVEYEAAVKDGEWIWSDVQANLDDMINDAVELAVDTITSGASKAFDTLKEIEDWINANSGNTPTLEGYATKEEVEAVAAQIPSIEGLAKESYVDEKIAEIEIPSVEGLATKEEVEAVAAQIPSIEGLAKEEWVLNKIAEAELNDKEIDLSGYATKTDVSDAEGRANTYTDSKIAELNIPSIEGLATKEETEAVKTWVTEQGYLTEHQDITGKQDVIADLDAIREGAAKGATALQEVPEEYVTNEELEAKGYATEVWVNAEIAKAQLEGGNVDLSGYATKEDIKGLASEQFVVEEIEKIEIPSIEGLATKEETEAVKTWVTEQGYLTEHQDISGLATKEELANVSASVKTVVEDLLIPENAKESLDTLEEISAWIQNHPEDVASMNAQIVALTASAHTHDNKDVLDGITAEKVTVWDAAEANAKGYTDDEIAKLSDVCAKKTDLEGLATETWVSNEIAKAQLEGEEIDLSGYATKDDIKGLATKEETEAVKTWVGEQGFLTEHQSLEGLATEQFVTDRISEIQIPEIDHLATKEEVNEIAGQIPTIDGLATETYVDEKIASINIPSIEGLATEAWVKEQNYLTEHQDITGKQDIIEDLEAIREGAAKGATALQEVPEEYVTNEELEAKGYLTEHQDLSGYATESWVSAEIAKAQLEGEDVDLSGYATKDDLNSLATKEETEAVKTWVGEQGFLTEHQDISGLATKEDVANAIAELEIPSVEGLATEQFVTDEIAKIEIPTLDGYATESWVNEQGFLTEHQDITGKQDVIADLEAIREGAAKGATALQEVPEEYATQTWVSTEIAKAQLEGEDIDLSGYATKDDIANFATKEELANVSASVKTVVEDLLIPENAKESLDTLEEISAWIQSHPDDAASMNAQIVALTASAHTHDNKDVLDGITAEKVAAWDSIEMPSLEGYATETWVAEQGYLTEHQDITGKQDVIADLETIREGAAKGATALQEVPEEYVTNEELEAKGYLTEHQDISGLATKDEVSEAVLSANTYADGLVENLKPYTNGTAIDITDYTVNVKVAEDGFLNVNEENELTVTGVTLDAAVTSKDIIIEGGAWESAVKAVFTGGTVPAGTTWESFLESMLCVEKFANSISTTPTFTVSCGNINPGIDKTGTVEVGTKVVLNETNANVTTASQSLTVKTFAGTDGKVYGYKLGEDGVHVNASTYTETLEPILKNSSDALKVTFTKFTDAVNNGSVLETITGNTVLPSVEMYAMEGTNKVIVYQTGDTYTSSSAVTAGTIYVATNLKNYYKADKKTPNTYVPTFAVSDKTASDSTEYTVTGAHYYYIGDVMDYSADYWDTDRSEMIRNLGTKGWANVATITKAHTFGVGTKQQTVVVPSKYTNVSGKDVNNGDVQFNLVKTFDFTNGQGYISSYNVFVAPSTDGLGSDSKITITIK